MNIKIEKVESLYIKFPLSKQQIHEAIPSVRIVQRCWLRFIAAMALLDSGVLTAVILSVHIQ